MQITNIVGDYFYYTHQATRRLEAMTNPLFPPGSAAGLAFLRGGYYASGAMAGMTDECLELMRDAERQEKSKRPVGRKE